MDDCPNDWVEFRDGRYGFSRLIGKFCGSDPPQTLVIARSGNFRLERLDNFTGFLWIRFRSDDQLEYAGFSAKIEMVRNRLGPSSSLGGTVYFTQLFDLSRFYSFSAVPYLPKDTTCALSGCLLWDGWNIIWSLYDGSAIEAKNETVSLLI